jgi:hypothetical protein
MGTGEDREAVPRPVGVGPEMAALSRFYRDVTWKGIIHEGGMGPGTPAMTAVGRGTVQAIQDGRWIALDCEQDQFLPDGTLVLSVASSTGQSPSSPGPDGVTAGCSGRWECGPRRTVLARRWARSAIQNRD